MCVCFIYFIANNNKGLCFVCPIFLYINTILFSVWAIKLSITAVCTIRLVKIKFAYLFRTIIFRRNLSARTVFFSEKTVSQKLFISPRTFYLRSDGPCLFIFVLRVPFARSFCAVFLHHAPLFRKVR